MSGPQNHFHERFDRATCDDSAEPTSNRKLCFVFAVVFALLGMLALKHGAKVVNRWTIASAGFLALGIIRPALAAPLNRFWTALGQLMSRVTNPIILAGAYYVIVLPTGLVMRLRGKDLLRLRHNRMANSYWIARRPPGPTPETMKNQF